MKCAHCSVESHPKLALGPSQAELEARLDALAEAGISYVLLTGGEPMLRKEVVFALLQRARRLGLNAGLYSNGFWGKKSEVAETTVHELQIAGLTNLALSFDSYHAEFQSLEPVLNIVKASRRRGLPVRVSITRARQEQALGSALESLAQLDGVPIRFYDLQPVGAAKALPPEEFRAESVGACNACGFLALTDDGRLTACNGPSYFEKEPSPLALGSLQQDALPMLLRRFEQDPLMNAIRTVGPVELLQTARGLSQLKDVDWETKFVGMCHACHVLCSQPQVVQALRQHLSEDAQAARQVALRRVLEGSRRGGQLDLRVLNGSAQARATLELDRDWETIWGRADLQWKDWMEQILDHGLALWVEAHRERLRRWAPEWVLGKLAQSAQASGIRHLVIKDCLRRLAGECDALGFRPVLLKGAALIARDSEDIPRVPGDVDLWLPLEQAQALRKHLLLRGWHGVAESSQGAVHHLAAVAWRGVAVEIHHRIMPAFWGLPEAEMLQTARPVPGYGPLQVLSNEAHLLHTMVHCSKHLLTHGLKAGWDLRWLNASGWDSAVLVDFASRLPFPRSLWTPLYHLSEQLGLPLPQGLPKLKQDRRQRWLAQVAARQLFGRAENHAHINPLLRLGFYALLSETYRQRLSLLFRLVGGDSAESGQAQRLAMGRFRWHELRRCIGEAWMAWRALRRSERTWRN